MNADQRGFLEDLCGPSLATRCLEGPKSRLTRVITGENRSEVGGLSWHSKLGIYDWRLTISLHRECDPHKDDEGISLRVDSSLQFVSCRTPQSSIALRNWRC